MIARRLIRTTVIPVALLAVVGASCSSAGGDSLAGEPGQSVALESGNDTPTPAPAGASVTLPEVDTPTGTDVLADQTVSEIGSSEDSRLLIQLFSALQLSTDEESAWAGSGGASESAIGDCMSDAGFQYSPMDLDSDAGSLMPTLSTPPEEFAARFGFGTTAFALGLIEPMEDPNAEYTSTLSQAEQVAFDETYRICLDTAPSENLEALPEPGSSAAMSVVIDQFRDVVTNDERLTTALGGWHDCLASSGFVYDNPETMRLSFDARQDGLSQEGLETLFAEEKTVAVANVPCEAVYNETFRQVVADRFGEFKSLYEAALASGVTPDANG